MTIDSLRNASALLQAGHHAQAREILANVVRAQPASFEAHRLLAGSLLQTGELMRARKELRLCLRLRAGDRETSLLLGRLLTSAGQAAEAVQVLAEAASIHPGNVEIACASARALLALGRPADALSVLGRVAAPPPVVAEFWMLLGHTHMALKRPLDAAAAFGEWCRLEPASQDARLRMAANLADGHRNVEAEAEARACLQSGGRTPDALFVLARALMGQGRFQESEALFREVVHAQPEHLTAQNNLSELVWMRTGELPAATAELDEGLRAQPRRHALRIARVRLLVNAGKGPEALADIDAGLALDARQLQLLNAGATIALDFDAPRALDYARRALQVSPDDRGAWVALGNASLGVGDVSQALAIANRLHAALPDDGRAVAMLADGLRLAGDDRYRDLLDYRHFVRADFLDVPPGWPGLESYLADLAPAMARMHVMHAHPVGNSLRQGSQMPLIPEESPDAAVRAFPLAIDGPIRRYIEALGTGSDEMRRRNTGAYRLSGMWTVRLRPHGFHVNHYHPEGWLSSACYLHLPPAVAGGGGEGWLKFGEPAFPTRPALGPEYVLKPEPGLLALFPSYMWHGTRPFAGEEGESRLTIAFDVVPAA